MPFQLLSFSPSKDKIQNTRNLLVFFQVCRYRKHIVINMLFKINPVVTCLQAFAALSHGLLKGIFFSGFFYTLSKIPTNLLKV